MTDKTKLVFNWIGPRGPIWNTELPNVLSFAGASEQCSINSHFWWNDDTWLMLFKHASDHYEIAPSFNLDVNDDSYFIYPFTLSWRIPFESYFMGRTGILEFSHMPMHLINLARYRNGYILINHSVEAFMGPGYISALHSYFGNIHNIPLHKIIYVTGCINSTEMYEQYCIDNNVPDSKDHRLTIISYPSSQTIFKPNLEESEAVYDTETIPEKLFLMWNRRYRNHRILLALVLESFGLIDKSYISFSDVDIERPTRKFADAVPHHLIQNWAMQIDPNATESFASRLPLVIDNETNINQMCADRGNVSRPYYQNSLVSLITETNFENAEVTLTEKSYKPIKEKHPFIIAGVNGALKGLRKAGFKTFGEFWNEGYDDIQDPYLRIQAISNIIKDISTWDNDRILDFKRRVKPILEHNFQVLKESSPRTMALEINNIIRGNHA
jgi:hypothetical protein